MLVVPKEANKCPLSRKIWWTIFRKIFFSKTFSTKKPSEKYFFPKTFRKKIFSQKNFLFFFLHTGFFLLENLVTFWGKQKIFWIKKNIFFLDFFCQKKNLENVNKCPPRKMSRIFSYGGGGTYSLLSGIKLFRLVIVFFQENNFNPLFLLLFKISRFWEVLLNYFYSFRTMIKYLFTSQKEFVLPKTHCASSRH
jgi:hypothetical protein